MDNLRTRLIACFELTFPDLPSSDIPSASQASVSDWDSIKAITLANIIEEQFEIEIDIDDLGNLDSFERIFEYLEKRGHVC